MSDFNQLGVVLKLISGETIICQVIADTDKTMIVRDPYVVNVITEKHDDGIRASTYYSDWFLGVASRIHMIQKEHVMSAAIPDLAVKKDYAALVATRNEAAGSPKANAAEQFDWNSLNYKINDKDLPGRN